MNRKEEIKIEGRTEAVEYVGKLEDEWYERARELEKIGYKEEAETIRECARDLATRISDFANTI